MRRKTATPPSVEVLFDSTPDGLLAERCVLKMSCAADEDDLRRFAQRVIHDVPGVTVTVQKASGEEQAS